VALAGLTLTNNEAGTPAAFTFPPLSFIGAGGFLKLTADGSGGAGHVPFVLDPQAGSLSLRSGGTLLDFVTFVSQTEGASQGRDNAGALTYYTVPTGGFPNVTAEPASWRPWLAWHAVASGSDEDGDGLDAFAEFALGTDPRAANSVPQQSGTPAGLIVSLPQNGGGYGRPEVTYTVEVSDGLSSPEWTVLAVKAPSAAWTGAGTVVEGAPSGGRVPVTVLDTPGAGRPRRFLRMVMSWTP
jgi:hypothetical protein